MWDGKTANHSIEQISDFLKLEDVFKNMQDSKTMLCSYPVDLISPDKRSEFMELLGRSHDNAIYSGDGEGFAINNGNW